MNIKSGQKLNSAAMFGCNGVMKRSPSQMALDELFNPTRNSEIEDGINPNNDQKSASDEDGEIFALQTNFSRLPFTNPSGTGNNFLRFNAPNDAPLWSQNLISKHPCHSGTIDSQSSICIGSPTSVTNPKSRKNQTATFATSGSSREQSDDDDLEIEIGQCEQSNDSIELKRFKRMVSNRESARRSRRRKQAHLADLEQQVDQLRGENASLFKQLANATQQFKDATTNNRVLKSDVEALRAKVKLAEDMVTRGSLTSSLSHLLQNYLNTQSLSNTNMCSVENVSPTITIRGDDPTGPYPLLGVSGQSAAVGLEIVENLNTNLKNRVSDDAVSCISDMWTWDSHAASVTK